MDDRHLVIIGGGLAGLSAGCYARASGFRTTIVEHSVALGGVCTAWARDPYLIDGCIHWLTGGPFAQLYRELGISRSVGLRPLDHWVTYRDLATGTVLPVTSDLDALARDLCALSPPDADEIGRIIEGARHFASTTMSLRSPDELVTMSERLRELWAMRGSIGTLVHFHLPVGVWAREHLRSERLRRFFVQLLPEGASILVLVMVLGYLERGFLSRPAGGTRAFRDALVDTYERLGGEVLLRATVDEVLVRSGRATGVRLADGTIVEASAVVSTSSLPETLRRLLGGRHGTDVTHERLAHWKLFDALVLASLGVDMPLADTPSLMVVDGLEPFEVGGRRNDSLHLRVCNDDPCFAPTGHTVVQAMLTTDYTWWATRGLGYPQEKEAVGELVVAQLERAIPGIGGHVRMVDIATPLTYWTSARAWRGAYEGWLPTPEALLSRFPKTLPGLHDFYMAGQWVEPGGGVPLALQSGRQAAELLCADAHVPFEPFPARLLGVEGPWPAPSRARE